MRRAMLLFACASMVAMGWTTDGAADEGAAPRRPEMADPADCRVAPRSREEMLGLAGLPELPPAAPASSVVPAPNGVPADPATVAAVEAALREFAACQAAGEDLRLFALFSDDRLRRTFAADERTVREAYDAWSTPVPGDRCDRTSCAWVVPSRPLDVRVLADRRIGVVTDAEVPADGPAPDGQVLCQYLVYVEDGGRYLIDDVRLVDADPGAAPAL